MRDFSGRTVRDLKAEIKKYEKDIVEYNDILNSYYFKKIFSPSGTYANSRVYTQKGTLRKDFVKQIKAYTRWIENRKDWIAYNTKKIKNLKAK